MLTTKVFNDFELREVLNVDVLVIEDDEDYLEILRALLKSDNFKIDYVKTAIEALAKIKNYSYNLVFLSASLNDTSSSKTLLDRIREVSLVPIIALVDIESEEGSNLVLEGADYDLQKPFTPRRLRAAVTAVLRRTEVGGLENSDPVLPETLTSGSLALSLGRLEVTINQKKISLSAREFSMLQFLMTNPNRVFTREELAAQAWGWAKGGEMRAVDSAIKRLRAKIEVDTRRPRFILTERSMGYRFNPAGGLHSDN